MIPLVRTKGGSVVHRATCRFAQYGNSSAVEWAYASRLHRSKLWTTVRLHRIKVCTACKPLDWSWWNT